MGRQLRRVYSAGKFGPISHEHARIEHCPLRVPQVGQDPAAGEANDASEVDDATVGHA